ncbi:MAG: GH116 family glycosyl hydrolase, partial [Spirochaetota bacterium]
KTYGLPRLAEASFAARFPFATVSLRDETMPIDVQITGWSPFIPGEADKSSLPAAALEYRFINNSEVKVEAVYSFNAANFMAADLISTDRGGAKVGFIKNGFMLWQPPSGEKPWEEGAFAASTPEQEVRVNHIWFRGDWWDPLTILWRDIERGAMLENQPVDDGAPSMGGSLFVPFALEKGAEKTVRLLLSWFVPYSSLCYGHDGDDDAGCGCKTGAQSTGSCLTYRPWYAERFADIQAVTSYWFDHYDELRRRSVVFRDCFYDTTLPTVVVEAIASNLTILKSPTVLRQADGRLLGWEGCCDRKGCCAGSCTHVWNYAQALCHLFPEMERTLRHTEFYENQDEDGRQNFRTALPIRKARAREAMLPASDGQLGGSMKIYREWRISADSKWLESIWPQVEKSMDFCIKEWDPDHKGVLVEPHHNTYDIEFWGPDSMCSSFYLGALKAAVEMGRWLEKDVALYEELMDRGVSYLEERLFDGEYFVQEIVWKGLKSGNPRNFKAHLRTTYSSQEAVELLEKEGPKYQYGKGCLSDGVVGVWMAAVCGLQEFLNPEKVKSHLLSVYKYNFRKDLSLHANPQRPTYALGREAGLLLCSWPKGGQPLLPFVYSNEVWTGIEYQVASHLMMLGAVGEGIDIVKAVRDRYDGRIRNPFNEYECGHWYTRAMSSYALIQGLTGIRYDAVEKKLYIKPSIKGDFRSFLCTATGFGTAGVEDGKPFIEVKSGKIEVESIDYRAYDQ